jgi:hypothetical protein
LLPTAAIAWSPRGEIWISSAGVGNGGVASVSTYPVTLRCAWRSVPSKRIETSPSRGS